MDLTEIFRKFYFNTKPNFSQPLNGTFFKIDHILGHTVSLNKYMKIKITACILSDRHGLKLDINNKAKVRDS